MMDARWPMPTPPFDPCGDLASRLVLIEASAGTGKTHSITTIFLRLLVEEEWTRRRPETPPIRPDQFLVVTFTEAATAEMRDRIRAKLRDAQEAFERALHDGSFPGPDDLQNQQDLRFLIEKGRRQANLPTWMARVNQALALFDDITISTIHGFCRRMLLQNTFESGAEFDRELVPDLRDLTEDVVIDLWMRQVDALTPEMLAALPPDLLQSLRAVAREAVANPELVLLPEVPPPLDPGIWERWVAIQREFAERWAREGEELLGFLQQALSQKVLDGRQYRKDFFEKMRDSLIPLRSQAAQGLMSPSDAQDLARLATRGVENGLSKKGRETGPLSLPPLAGFLEELLQVRDQVEMSLKALQVRLRLDLCQGVREMVARRKEQARIQGFDDLLRYLRDGLTRKANRQALRRVIANQYRVALIDEFQDTDPVQWAIFRAVFVEEDPSTPPGCLWVVGDPKQAIYSFRQADVNTYLEARRTPAMQSLRLDRNWRSDQRLVEAINILFRQDRLVWPFLKEGIVYEPIEAGHREKRFEAPESDSWKAPFRIAFLPRRDEAHPLPKKTVHRIVPHLVAQDIRDFLGSRPRILPDTGRPWRTVRPGDIAVLVRSHRQGIEVQRALRLLDIPSVRRTQESIFSTDECLEVARVLGAVLNPRDRRAVLSGLSTPLLGVGAGEILDLENGLEVADHWFERLNHWHHLWSRHGFMKMFRRILMERGGIVGSLQWPDGERRVTNLLHLGELLHDSARRNDLGPEGLLAWLNRQREETDDETPESAEARLLRLESDAEAVQIVTIHASKGLQYPFVWCPYLWEGKRPRSPKEENYLKFHRESDGRITMDLDPTGPEADQHQRIAEQERFSEDLRMAYVALTRAIHACTIVTGVIKETERAGQTFLIHAPRALREILQNGEPMTPWRAIEALKDLLEQSHSEGDARIRQDLDDLVRASTPEGQNEGTIHWFCWDKATATEPLQAMEGEIAEALRASRWAPERSLRGHWGWSNFSTMTRGEARGDDEDSPEDTDLETLDEEPGTDVSRGGPDEGPPSWTTTESGSSDSAKESGNELMPPEEPPPLNGLRRGRGFGTYLHKVLEDLDFSNADAETILWTVRKWQAPFGVLEEPGQEEVILRLAEGIRRVLQTHLGLPAPGATLDASGGKGPRLADLRREETLREWPFVIPVRGTALRGGGRLLTPHRLAEAMGTALDAVVTPAYLARLESLPFSAFEGFLNGTIDLVFRYETPGQGPRWYLADYKSNRLPRDGSQSGSFRDYRPEALREEMARNHYILQYHLYLVALHRYLRWRLPDYAYDRHMGGVFYLFVRGMQGPEGTGDCGVFRDRPPRPRIEALSALFGEEDFPMARREGNP